MNIKQATLKLTLLYTFILLLISCFFSANLYRVSLQEINTSFKRQASIIQQKPDLRYLLNDEKFLKAWESEYDHATKKLLTNLFLMNIFVLFIGGLLSYLFAKKTLEPLEKAHEAQSRFTADASHELRTPISVIRSEIEVALKDKNLTVDEAREVMLSNLEEVNRLTQMIESLLNLSRLGVENIKLENFVLKNIISEIIKNFEKPAKDKSIKIKYISDNLKVKSNKDYLSQIIAIVIDNAIKYSPDKSEISIQTINENNKINIKVIDEGPGISKEDKNKVFERFYRSDSSRSKSNVEGLGLGLSLAKEISSKIGSEIIVEENKPQGSVFIIKVPKA